jgi:L-ascorbate metabolism protein UlaG (beta-lactamase superfamily)
MAATCSLTHIGGPTALIEVDGVRLLTDPTFDPPGQHYSFGFGTGSTKISGPAIALDALGAVDAVLLSHDQHSDNLDHSGREYLSRARRVLTTKAGAKRLGGRTEGLAPWEITELTGGNGHALTITATPARHRAAIPRLILRNAVSRTLR